jgi:hypothetical protein
VSLKKLAYTLHKPTGQARVGIDGKDYYLGLFDSNESWARYDDKIADWLAKHDDPAGFTIDDLMVLYTAHAREHYRTNGEETSEVNCIAQAVRPLSRLPSRTFSMSVSRETAQLCGCSTNFQILRIRT